jgi:hypothetical protein
MGQMLKHNPGNPYCKNALLTRFGGSRPIIEFWEVTAVLRSRVVYLLEALACAT